MRELKITKLSDDFGQYAGGLSEQAASVPYSIANRK
jgi:hypothetical protein